MNYAMLAGYNTFRAKVGANRYLPSSEEQKKQAQAMLLEEMKEGAWGISFGAEYDPAMSFEEIVEAILAVSKDENQIVTMHYREDGPGSIEAVNEMIRIAAAIPQKFQISHLSSCSAMGTMDVVLDMICFGFAREEPMKAPEEKMQLKKSLGEILRNKPFMRITVMWTAWCFTANLSGAYLTPYSMNVMGLDFLQITLFGTVASSLATALIISKWGRALDSHGSRNVMLVAGIGAAITPVFYVMASPGNIWPTLLHNVIGALFWSGTNLAANSMQLSNSPEENRPMYIAIFSCITCLVGTALGTMCGGWLLTWAEHSGMFGGWFDRYKALAVLSVILRLGITLLLVPGMSNESDSKAKDVVRFFMPDIRKLKKLHFRRVR